MTDLPVGAGASPARIVWTTPPLRLAALVLALQGAVICSYMPYVSDLAVNRFGFGDRGYAVLMALASLISVGSAVAVGIRTDQTARRRGMALAAALALVAGAGLMVLAPGKLAFAVTLVVLLPFAGTIFGQVFAMARLASSGHPGPLRDGVMSVIRALLALPFIIVLPLWALAFAAGVDVMAVFPVALVLGLILLAVLLRLWPQDGATPWVERPSGLSLRGALAEIGRGRTLGRVVALGAVNAGPTLYMALVALTVGAAPGRAAADVALYVGLIAGLEVPVMVLAPRLLAGVPRTRQILAGAALYGLHLGLMPWAAPAGGWLWPLVVPAAVGGALVLTVPIAYLQDLLADRPGAGASLMALQRLTGDVIAACCFAAGTLLSGYALAAGLGVAVSVAGGLALILVDRRRG
ncbi:MFS transporter [Xinfangfangia pollutisoli]|uniref:hypothetical protein n=1 Tax=Xinfangfangia pollutisoli TaxID=2865960 RepID=UPI001CD53A19|nr:hypothetical protein [Xinfangfangia pollutisoli]